MRFRSAVNVASKFARGVCPIWSRMTKSKSVRPLVLFVDSVRTKLNKEND